MESQSKIEERIRQVVSEYNQEKFTPLMDLTVKTILDLFLEYPDLDDFISLVVLIPKVLLNWKASLYLAETDTKAVLVASSNPEEAARHQAGEIISRPLSTEPILNNGSYLLPLPRPVKTPLQEIELDTYPVIGLLRVYSDQDFSSSEQFFLRKYTELVALSVVHRRLAKKNLQHINFIKSLVTDIGHNVILPNVFFKAYLRRLAGKIERLAQVQKRLELLSGTPPPALTEALEDLAEEMANANEGLTEEFDHIQKHYVNTSLFLETLLRKSHFEKGRYVLQKKTCNFKKDIVEPQVEQCLPKLRNRKIEVDLSTGGVPDQIIEAVVDVGLISQVVANLLSNAVKYTRPSTRNPQRGKFIAYGLELIKDAFGIGEDGVKINMFSSGPPLDARDAEAIFQEGYRGANVGEERGTGHGLYFVKEVIALHGGRVGYEATEMGNNFYFILPK